MGVGERGHMAGFEWVRDLSYMVNSFLLMVLTFLYGKWEIKFNWFISFMEGELEMRRESVGVMFGVT